MTRIPLTAWALALAATLSIGATQASASACDQSKVEPIAASALEALESVMESDCSKVTAAASLETLEALLEKFRAEQLSIEDAQQLAEVTLSIECTMSAQAAKALNALKAEVRVRKLNVRDVLSGQVALATPEILPSEWAAMMEEASHFIDPQVPIEKIEPITLGCIAAGVTYAAGTTACILDVNTAEDHCTNYDLCSGVSLNCCFNKGNEDRLNCFLSGGINGPDGDYDLCCP